MIAKFLDTCSTAINRTGTNIKTWWQSKALPKIRVGFAWFASVCTSIKQKAIQYYKDPSKPHNRAIEATKKWWAQSSLKPKWDWLHQKTNALIEASVPYIHGVHFVQNLAKGFTIVWGAMVVFSLYIDPAIILAGGAVLSNFAFGAAILIAFVYAYNRLRAERVLAKIAEEHTKIIEEVTHQKECIKTLKTTVEKLTQKLCALEPAANDDGNALNGPYGLDITYRQCGSSIGGTKQQKREISELRYGYHG